ncbi:MAG: FHA domain-containing protein [Cellulomonadaceae bacterium]|nr:FHA domain-containing protein [Cellulomonadaceae bacterium]
MLAFDTGQREYLATGAAAVLGRSPRGHEPTDVALVVRDPDGTVSKTHLRIEHARDGVWLTDLGSTNGSALLDDAGLATPLPPGVRTLLTDGDGVRLGRRAFTVSSMLAER